LTRHTYVKYALLLHGKPEGKTTWKTLLNMTVNTVLKSGTDQLGRKCKN